MTERCFIVGVQRCGTTYLYHLLNDHPEIVMASPVRPEPKVFLDDRVAGDPAGYDRAIFPADPAGTVRGEKSTSYLDHERALERIEKTFPHARYLVALRDPVERALSHYRFSVAAGVERRDIATAVRDDIAGKEPSYDDTISVSPFAYVRRGNYVDSLRRLGRYVAQEHVHVVVLEELVDDPTVRTQVYRYLGVDDGHVADVPPTATNSSNSGSVLPARVRSVLQEYFAPLNAELAAYLGRAIDRWQ